MIVVSLTIKHLFSYSKNNFQENNMKSIFYISPLFPLFILEDVISVVFNKENGQNGVLLCQIVCIPKDIRARTITLNLRARASDPNILTSATLSNSDHFHNSGAIINLSEEFMTYSVAKREEEIIAFVKRLVEDINSTLRQSTLRDNNFVYEKTFSEKEINNFLLAYLNGDV